ncbi:DNA repair protein [Lentinula boryana]|uniref:DNA repair protein n=2 Tax=Lentinula TaxID=5352 RepID=A0A9W8NVF8_9AGAR|nr:DNA repair protein [Lentinula detonsa]KAJ3992456.1 DNA repair protein [Lentinula boryana]
MHARVSQQTQEARISELQAEVERLQAELGQDEDAEKIVHNHIKLLHQYNEAKDAAQILIGRLANLRETTVRQIHKDLELPIGD